MHLCAARAAAVAGARARHPAQQHRQAEQLAQHATNIRQPASRPTLQRGTGTLLLSLVVHLYYTGERHTRYFQSGSSEPAQLRRVWRGHIFTVHDLAGQTTRSQAARCQRRRRPQHARSGGRLACPPPGALSSQHALLLRKAEADADTRGQAGRLEDWMPGGSTIGGPTARAAPAAIDDGNTCVMGARLWPLVFNITSPFATCYLLLRCPGFQPAFFPVSWSPPLRPVSVFPLALAVHHTGTLRSRCRACFFLSIYLCFGAQTCRVLPDHPHHLIYRIASWVRAPSWPCCGVRPLARRRTDRDVVPL